MDEQAIHAVLRRRKLRVVEIIGVNRNSVRKCREARGGLELRSYDDDVSSANTELLQVLAAYSSRLRARASQSQAQSIKNRFLAEFNDVCRNVFVSCVYNKFADIVREAGGLGESGDRRNVRGFCGSNERAGERAGSKRGDGCFPEVTPQHVQPRYSSDSFLIASLAARRVQIVTQHLAALHYKFHALKFCDVGQGVPADSDEIGEFPALDGADVGAPPHHLRIHDGGGANDLRRSHSKFHHVFEFLGLDTMRKRSDSGPKGNCDPGGDGTPEIWFRYFSHHMTTVF